MTEVSFWIPGQFSEMRIAPLPEKLWMRERSDDGPVGEFVEIQIQDRIPVKPGFYDVLLDPDQPYGINLIGAKDIPSVVVFEDIGLKLYYRKLEEGETWAGEGVDLS